MYFSYLPQISAGRLLTLLLWVVAYLYFKTFPQTFELLTLKPLVMATVVFTFAKSLTSVVYITSALKGRPVNPLMLKRYLIIIPLFSIITSIALIIANSEVWCMRIFTVSAIWQMIYYWLIQTFSAEERHDTHWYWRSIPSPCFECAANMEMLHFFTRLILNEWAIFTLSPDLWLTCLISYMISSHYLTNILIFHYCLLRGTKDSSGDS